LQPGQLPPGFNPAAAAHPPSVRNPAEEALGPLNFDAEGRPSFATPPAPAAPQRSNFERGIELGIQGVGRGAADIIGAPIDIMALLSNLLNAGIEKVGGIFGADIDLGRAGPNTIGGSNWIADTATPIAEAIGLDVLDPSEMTPFERATYNINRFGTQALVGGTALARGAAVSPFNTAVQANAPIPQTMGGRIANAFMSPYYANPTRTIVGDVAAGAGAGTANWLYQEKAAPYFRENYGPVADALANLGVDLLGGLAGVTTANLLRHSGNALLNTGRNVLTGTVERSLPRNVVTGQPFTREDANLAVEMLRRTTTSPERAQENIADFIARYGSEVGRNEYPTAGLLSDDIGLIMLENASRARSPQAFIARDQNVADAALSAANRIAPSSAQGRDFTDFMEDEFTNLLSEGQQAAVPYSTIAGQRDQAIQDIDRIVTENLRAQQSASAARYAAVGDDLVDISSLQRELDAAAASAGKLGLDVTGVPSDLADRISAVIDAGGQVAVSDIAALWPDLARMTARAKQAGNVTLRQNLSNLQEGFTRILEDAAANGNPSAQRWMEAQAGYRDELGATFGAGAADRFRRDVNKDPTDRSFAPESQTAQRFLRPGDPEAAAQLNRILAGKGEQAVHNYLVADMAHSNIVNANGTLNTDRLLAWRERWGGVIDQVSPMTARMIDQTLSGFDNRTNLPEGALASEIMRARRQVANPDLNRGAFEFALGNNPTNAVQAIFTSGDPERAIQDVLRTIGDNPEALNGLRAAVREYLRETKTTSNVSATASGERPLSWAQFDNMYTRYEGALAQIFTPEEMNALQQAHAFLRPFVNRQMGATVGSPTTERSQLVEQFFSFAEAPILLRFGMLKGGGILRIMRRVVNTFRPDDVAAGAQQLIQQMWFDPELAMHLFGRPAKEVGSPGWNAQLMRLLAYAEGSRQLMGGDPMAVDELENGSGR